MTFKQRLFTLLLGLLFATVLTHQASALYDPGAGRFCSRDPIGYIAGPNHYAYANGHSLSTVDAFGNEEIELPVLIDLPAKGPIQFDVHLSKATCKKPGECVEECGKREDFCMFYFIGVFSPESAVFQMYKTESGKCRADLNRTTDKSFLKVSFNDKVTCKLTPEMFDLETGSIIWPEFFNVNSAHPRECKDRLTYVGPNNDLGGAMGTQFTFKDPKAEVASVDYDLTLETFCGCESAFPGPGESYTNWGPIKGAYKATK